MNAQQLGRSMKPAMTTGPLLVREYIDKILYGGTSAYFNANPVISQPPKPIDFAALKGEKAYRQHLHDLYWENPYGWMTPVEIFQPAYSLGILSWIRSKFRPGEKHKLQILEIGGGLGTCAKNILDHVREHDRDLYASASYTLLDLSEQYHRQQQDVLAGHEDKCRFHLGSAADLPEFDSIQAEVPTFVLALECLDNLSHDKICDHHQIMVKPASDSTAPWVEYRTPVSDPLIAEYLEIMSASDLYERESAMSKILHMEQCEFLPTSAFSFLKRLTKQIPNHHLLVADFNYLPDAIPGALNSPIVAERSLETAGDTRDHDTYLLPEGVRADVFFPVDFERLKYVYDHLRGDRHGQRSQVQTSREFLLQYADHSRCRTASGYNPLLEDYVNTSIFTS